MTFFPNVCPRFFFRNGYRIKYPTHIRSAAPPPATCHRTGMEEKCSAVNDVSCVIILVISIGISDTKIEPMK